MRRVQHALVHLVDGVYVADEWTDTNLPSIREYVGQPWSSLSLSHTEVRAEGAAVVFQAETRTGRTILIGLREVDDAKDTR